MPGIYQSKYLGIKVSHGENEQLYFDDFLVLCYEQENKRGLWLAVSFLIDMHAKNTYDTIENNVNLW